jgi:hypothetical protein
MDDVDDAVSLESDQITVTSSTSTANSLEYYD